MHFTYLESHHPPLQKRIRKEKRRKEKKPWPDKNWISKLPEDRIKFETKVKNRGKKERKQHQE